MNKRAAQQIAREIAREIARTLPALRVTGTRSYGRGSYALNVRDTINGGSFVIYTREGWDERKREAQDA